jgi:hypothetical protein
LATSFLDEFLASVSNIKGAEFVDEIAKYKLYDSLDATINFALEGTVVATYQSELDSAFLDSSSGGDVDEAEKIMDFTGAPPTSAQVIEAVQFFQPKLNNMKTIGGGLVAMLTNMDTARKAWPTSLNAVEFSLLGAIVSQNQTNK